jgi:hypothetical protein
MFQLKIFCLLECCCLDFKYLSGLSSAVDPNDDNRIELKHDVISTYFKQYFKQLVQEGHHILYSFPISTQATSRRILLSATSFSFQFYGLVRDTETGSEYDAKQHTSERGQGSHNILVVYGIQDKDLAPPPPSYSRSWSLTKQEALFGSFSLSRNVFLQGWLLPKLRWISWRTALPPARFRIDKGGEWRTRKILSCLCVLL